MGPKFLFSCFRFAGTILTAAATLYYAFESSRRKRNFR